MTKFLDDLKNAADNGEFNSEVAKKINEVAELAEKKINEITEVNPDTVKAVENAMTDRIKERMEKDIEANPDTVKAVTEEEALELNSEYEKKMKKLKEIDAVNARLATLIEIEDMVKASIVDMLGHVEELEEAFSEEPDSEFPIYGDLSKKMEEIKSKYKF